MEKKFSPLPPRRKPLQEISSSEIEGEDEDLSDSDSDEEESDSESEIDEDPVQNRFRRYEIQIHRTVSFVRRRRSSLQKRFSSFKYLKLEDDVLFSLEKSSTDEEERDSELPQQVSPQASSINFFAEPQQPPTKPFKPEIEGSAIKIGKITCFLAFNSRGSPDSTTNGGSTEKQICTDTTIPECDERLINDLVKKLDLVDLEPAPDLKSFAFSKTDSSIFDLHQVNYGTNRNISFAKSRAPSEIKKNDRSTGSKFFNDLMFFESDLVSPCLDLKNRFTVKCWSGSFDLDNVFITFDPGGSPTNTAVAVASHNWLIDHHGVCIVVFDPGGNRHQAFYTAPPPGRVSVPMHSPVWRFTSRSFLSTLCSVGPWRVRSLSRRFQKLSLRMDFTKGVC